MTGNPRRGNTPAILICSGTKRPADYLCRGCWVTLQPAARRALNLRDATAVRRLSDLLEQLRAGVALHQIQITR